MRKFAIAAIALGVFAVGVKVYFPAPKTFAFDKTFPEDGTTWQFTVVLDEQSTPLAEKEASLLDKFDMSPNYRCESRIFGVSWINSSSANSGFRSILLQMYTLNLEDTSPPDPNTFIVRHALFGIKVPMSVRCDKFTCASG